jgi:membrane-bound serine protease (ClpP class)
VSDPGERRFVTTAEKTKLIDDVAADERAWKPVESYTDAMTGKVITVTQPVDRANELLTMSQYDAVAFGFACGIASSLDDLSQKLDLAATPKVYEKTGWEGFAMWLNSPLIRGILLVIVMIGAYMEFQSPGLILPGVTALIALVVFLAAPYAAGLASIWTIIVFVIGAVLLAVEIFVIPGFGIAGILGILLIVVALLASFVPAEPEAPTFSLPSLQGTWDGLVTGLKVLIGSIVISMVGMVLVARYLPRSRMVAGVISANPMGAALAISDAHPDVAQVGDVGVVTGDLRPGGQARFGQEVVDVQSQGEYIEAGRRVQVIRRAGMTIVVEPLPHDGTA